MAQSIALGVTTFQDNFYKKEFLIEKATFFRMKIGDRVFPQVLLGKDGWMEYVGDNSIDSFQNIGTFKNKKDFLIELTIVNKYLKSQGITLLIVVAPNKSTIYPDKLPEQIKPLPTQSKLDSIISYLENNNLPLIVDTRPALLAARRDHDVFYKTDTHWNAYGAFAAYTTIINTLESSYPELKPYKAEDLEFVTTDSGMHDIPNLLQANFIKEPFIFFTSKIPLVQTLHPSDKYGYNQSSWIPDSKLPTLLMFHDSFGESSLNDYLSMNFGKSNFIHLQSMPQYFTQKSIQYFKPNVIIIEIVERDIQALSELLAHWESP
jgi:hypothetical protein